MSTCIHTPFELGLPSNHQCLILPENLWVGTSDVPETQQLCSSEFEFWSGI